MSAETAEVITPEQIVAQLRAEAAAFAAEVASLRAEVASLRAEVEAFATDLTELRLDLQRSDQADTDDPPAR